MQKTRTTVTIAGQEYTITGYDPESSVRRVAEYVDRKMRELSAAVKLPQEKLAVLTAINATDDMLRAKDEVQSLKTELGLLREELEKLKSSEKE